MAEHSRNSFLDTLTLRQRLYCGMGGIATIGIAKINGISEVANLTIAFGGATLILVSIFGGINAVINSIDDDVSGLNLESSPDQSKVLDELPTDDIDAIAALSTPNWLEDVENYANGDNSGGSEGIE